MDKKLELWRKEGKHLPAFLKDFHDQKDFFKFLHEFNNPQNIDELKDIDWVKGHIYALDIFLWTLARYGWTLQKNSSKQNFEDLDVMISEFNKNRDKMFADILNTQINKKDENENNR